MDNLCSSTINDCGAAVIWLCRNKKYLKRRCRWAKYGDKVWHDKTQRCSYTQYERTIQNDTIRYYDTNRHESFYRHLNEIFWWAGLLTWHLVISGPFHSIYVLLETLGDNEEKRGGYWDFQSTWRGPTHTRQLQVISVVLTRLVNLTNMSFVLTHWHYRYVVNVWTDPIFCLHTQITQDVWPQTTVTYVTLDPHSLSHGQLSRAVV